MEAAMPRYFDAALVYTFEESRLAHNFMASGRYTLSSFSCFSISLSTGMSIIGEAD